MSTPVSALGSSLSGAGSLIGAVSNLLPQGSSTKGRSNTKSSATSETEGSQLTLAEAEANRTGLNINDSNQARTSTGTESTEGRTATNSRTQGVESFSGQKNSSSSQTLLDDKAIMRIMNMMLQGDENSIGGLQSIVQGERTAGIFNSSTNQMLTSDLMTRIAGEAARLGAKTVQTQDLGATTTTSDSTTSSVTDAVSKAISALQDNLRSQDMGLSSTKDTSKNSSLDLAQQLVNQTAESETNNKTKTKSGIFGGCFLTTMVVQGLGKPDDCMELETLRSFRDTWLQYNYPDDIATYYAEAPEVVEQLKTLPESEFMAIVKDFHANFILPVVYHVWQGEYVQAYEKYKDMIAKSKELASQL